MGRCPEVRESESRERNGGVWRRSVELRMGSGRACVGSIGHGGGGSKVVVVRCWWTEMG